MWTIEYQCHRIAVLKHVYHNFSFCVLFRNDFKVFTQSIDPLTIQIEEMKCHYAPNLMSCIYIFHGKKYLK